MFLLAGQFPGTSPGQALASTLAYARAAEQAGFTGVWIAEHHFSSYGSCPSALALAGYLLGGTTTLRIGTAACVLSSRHPVVVGEEAAMLAEVSGGRLDLGIARGGTCAPHARAHLAYVADTTCQARETLQASMPRWLAAAGAATRIDGTPGPARDPAAYLRQLMAMHPVGDPDLCVRRLTDAITSTGVRHVLLMVEGAGDTAATVENITRLGAEVIPRLRCRAA